MKKNDIVLLTLWDWKEVIVEMNIEDFMSMQDEDERNWRKTFYLSKTQEEYSYSDIKRKKGKTQYISLPEPKQEKKELTTQEKKDFLMFDSEMKKKSYEASKKKFLTETRPKLWKELEGREKHYWIQTTQQMQEELNELRQKVILLELKQWLN